MCGRIQIVWADILDSIWRKCAEQLFHSALFPDVGLLWKAALRPRCYSSPTKRDGTLELWAKINLHSLNVTCIHILCYTETHYCQLPLSCFFCSLFILLMSLHPKLQVSIGLRDFNRHGSRLSMLKAILSRSVKITVFTLCVYLFHHRWVQCFHLDPFISKRQYITKTFRPIQEPFSATMSSYL